MSKYTALGIFLRGRTEDTVPMTFNEIEQVIGTSLPPAAFNHRAWWANNRSGSVITRWWLDAGFKSERVDMAAQRLVFRRVSPTGAAERRVGVSPVIAERSPAYAVGGRHPLFGALKGLARVAAGTDLTQPADPDWETTTR